MKKISIVSPCYNEEANVQACYETVRSIMQRDLPDYSYEHVFADNASTDRTVDVLRQIAQSDRCVKVIINARNYGPFRSTFNALKSTTGDAVLVMLPVDLQDPPDLIPEFVKHWASGKMVVIGQRVDRSEGRLMQSVRKLYYRVLYRLSDIEIPVDSGEFQLVDRKVLDAVIESDDYYPYIRGLIANVGYADSTVMVPYRWGRRKRGLSKNSLINLVDQGMNGIVSFTSAPLRLAALAGFVLSILSFLVGLVQLGANLILYNAAPPGVPTLIVAVFFLAGVQLFFIGLLGEYIAAIHQQTRRGGRVVERETINLQQPEGPTAGRRSGPDAT